MTLSDGLCDTILILLDLLQTDNKENVEHASKYLSTQWLKIENITSFLPF